MSKQGSVIAYNPKTGEPEIMVGVDDIVPGFVRLDIGKTVLYLGAKNARTLMERLRFYAETIDPS